MYWCHSGGSQFTVMSCCFFFQSYHWSFISKWYHTVLEDIISFRDGTVLNMVAVPWGLQKLSLEVKSMQWLLPLTSAILKHKWSICILGNIKCSSSSLSYSCWHYYDLWSVTNCKAASHKQHTEQFNKRPTLCIKDLTRWLIAIARGTFNPVIVSQSCCPVIYSCCSATVSVLEFLMPYSLSQSCSVMRTWLPVCVCAFVLYVSARGKTRDSTGRMRASEGDRDR